MFVLKGNCHGWRGEERRREERGGERRRREAMEKSQIKEEGMDAGDEMR